MKRITLFCVSILILVATFFSLSSCGSLSSESSYSSADKTDSSDKTDICSHQRINHGTCEKCNTVVNAYDALAYYVLSNGVLNSDGSKYYLAYSDSPPSCSIDTDDKASTLSFHLSSTTSNNGSLTLLMTSIENINSTMPTVHTSISIFSGKTNLYFVDGKISAATFSGSNNYIYDYTDILVPSYLRDEMKKLCESSTDLLLNIVSSMLPDNITMPMLGFSNY